jgi:hypothetical protein
MTKQAGEPFDPYRKWLGIPKAQQPPTHYQILGLVHGEDDADVIEEAAIRQTTHVRAYQVGPNGEVCTRILNEIARARQVLLNAESRAAYDRKLAESTAEIATAQQPTDAGARESGSRSAATIASGGGKAVATFEPADAVASAGPARKSRKKRSAKRTRPKGIPRELLLGFLAGGGVLVLGVIALIVALLRSPTIAADPVANQVPMRAPPTPPPAVDIKPPVNPRPLPETTPRPEPKPIAPKPVEAKPIEAKPPQPAPVVNAQESADFIGLWHFPMNAPANRLQADMRVENRNGVLTARLDGVLTVKVDGAVNRTSGAVRVDSFRVVDGKFVGDVVHDDESPSFWKDLKTITLVRRTDDKILTIFRTITPTNDAHTQYPFGRIANVP